MKFSKILVKMYFKESTLFLRIELFITEAYLKIALTKDSLELFLLAIPLKYKCYKHVPQFLDYANSYGTGHHTQGLMHSGATIDQLFYILFPGFMWVVLTYQSHL